MFKNIKSIKGFTLAELLIVVAIIAVLVGISIPVFTTQLEKARDATSLANMRAAYAEASVILMTEESDNLDKEQIKGTVVIKGVKFEGKKKDAFSGKQNSLPFVFLEEDAEPEPGVYNMVFDAVHFEDLGTVAYIYQD